MAHSKIAARFGRKNNAIKCKCTTCAVLQWVKVNRSWPPCLTELSNLRGIVEYATPTIPQQDALLNVTKPTSPPVTYTVPFPYLVTSLSMPRLP
jgi:hypothetical protein